MEKEKQNPIKDALTQEISRRNFFKISAVAGGTAALAGCATSGLEPVVVNDWNRKVSEATIVPTASCHNCGGRCQLYAHVKDGTVVRITTDEEPEEGNYLQLRACLRGRANRNRLYHPDRLKYPMKRVGKRGEGKFERISWDEALDITASELKRIKEKYGPEAIYVNYSSGVPSLIREDTLMRRLLGFYGGFLNFYGTYSTACTQAATPYTYGTPMTGNSRDSLLASKMIILWGFNPAETIHGTNTAYYIRKAKEAGAKIVVVDPRYSDTAGAFADEWIAPLPTTDNALMDAMIYVMIKENLYDRDFVNKYCIGFDEDQMPEDVPPNNSLKSYILGQEDGVPKTPEWAESITKVPADTIRRLAREYATIKPAALVQGWGPQRHSYGEQPVRGATVLAAITGNVGIKGGWASGSGYVTRTMPGALPISNPVKTSISMFTWTEAIIRGKEMGPGDGVKGAERLSSDIKLIFNLAGNTLLNQHSDCNGTAKILEDDSKCEFILVTEHFMTPSAKFADILLPSDHFMEREDIVGPWVLGDYLLYQNKAVDTVFECRDAYDWISDLADRLGLKEQFTEGKTKEGWLRYIVDVTRKNHPEFPTFEEFKKRGNYKWRFDEPLIAFKAQIKDPENNPFPTPSGKIEIFSKALYDMGNPEEIPAIPKYVDSWEGPNDPLKAKYPLQCIGYHIKRRAHSTHDTTPWLEEAEKQSIWINPQDAKARGIEDGEKVKVYNDRGVVEIPATVTVRIMPGVVAIPQGAWYTPDSRGVDIRGCINTLTKYHPTPLAKGNPQHTNLVQVERI